MLERGGYDKPTGKFVTPGTPLPTATGAYVLTVDTSDALGNTHEVSYGWYACSDPNQNCPM